MTSTTATASRDLVLAKDAFKVMDIELSIAAHDKVKLKGDAIENHAGEFHGVLCKRDEPYVKLAESRRVIYKRPHQAPPPPSPPLSRLPPPLFSGDANDYVKSLIFGGLDGIITTFAIVCAIVGADMNVSAIITIGVSNVIADGISMGLGDYISSKAEYGAVQAEYAREKWELENYPEGEYVSGGKWTRTTNAYVLRVLLTGNY